MLDPAAGVGFAGKAVDALLASVRPDDLDVPFGKEAHLLGRQGRGVVAHGTSLWWLETRRTAQAGMALMILAASVTLVLAEVKDGAQRRRYAAAKGGP